MQKLANLSISGDPLCTGGPMWPREGTLLLVGNARDRVVCCQVSAGHVPEWSKLWTLPVRFARFQDGPATVGEEEDSSVCLFTHCCGK